MWPWQEGSDDRALPRWRHWLWAALLLVGAQIGVPIVAIFT